MTTYRAADLLKELTLEEKVRLVCAGRDWETHEVPSRRLPSVRLVPAQRGIARQHGSSAFSPTRFPAPPAMAATWNETLVEQIGQAIGKEASYLNIPFVLGPAIDTNRAILGAGNSDSYSEDPLLSAAMGTAWVKGVEGTGVGAAVGFFPFESQITGKGELDQLVDDRTLHEAYLAAFRRVLVDSRPQAFVVADNAINGTRNALNHRLLNDTVREQWCYQGAILADSLPADLAEQALEAGVDLISSPHPDQLEKNLLGALEEGTLLQGDLEEAAERVLDLILSPQGTDSHQASALAFTDRKSAEAGHAELAGQVAQESIVLLKNEDDTLPLEAGSPNRTIGVVGALAEHPLGGDAHDSYLESLRKHWGEDVLYAPGYRIEGGTDEELLAQAEKLAAASDTLVVFLGTPESPAKAQEDRESLDIPEEQEELLESLLCLNEDVVVVLCTGGVVRVTPWVEAVPAVLLARDLGPSGPAALARVIFGEVNPSGKLQETIPARLEDTPDFFNFPGEEGVVLHGERFFVGYRWYDHLLLDVSFIFGHGLSYTAFEYSDLSVHLDGEELKVSFTVTNKGERDGAETAQLYIGARASQVSRPERDLRAFGKQFLVKDESHVFVFSVPLQDLAYYSMRDQDWILEPGEYLVEVGASARDIRLEGALVIPEDASESIQFRVLDMTEDSHEH